MAHIKHDPQLGERFGMLVVTELGRRKPRTPAQEVRNQPGQRAVEVRCDCGRVYEVTITNLYSSKWPTRMCKSSARSLGNKGRARTNGRFEKEAADE
jgi:hypothetical protein